MSVNCDNDKYLVNLSDWITSRNFYKNCIILKILMIQFLEKLCEVIQLLWLTKYLSLSQ